MDNRKERLKEIIGSILPKSKIKMLSKTIRFQKVKKSQEKVQKVPLQKKLPKSKYKMLLLWQASHIKSNCHYMNTDRIFSRLIEMEQNYREHWQKKNQYREHIKKLLKETRYQKYGKKYNALWKNQIVQGNIQDQRGPLTY